MSIRWMLRRDMQDVLKIEYRSFDWPWSEDDFMHCLSHHNRIGLVYEQEDKIMGYIVYETLEDRIRVLNIAVHPNHRRQGIGVQLLDALKGRLKDSRATVDMYVSEDNLNTQLFLKKNKFIASNVEKNFYKDFDLDAYYFSYSLSSGEKLNQEVGTNNV